MDQKLPSLVIVGRPNVGKSTLFNRLTGTRRAIVTDEPGITRDRIYGKAEWSGRVLEIVDTGGIVPDDKALIPTEILRQARVAFDNAALLVLVVDSQDGLTHLDEELARLLRSTGKPFVVAVNKIDSRLQEVERLAVSYSLACRFSRSRRSTAREWTICWMRLCDRFRATTRTSSREEKKAGRDRHHWAAKRGQIDAAESPGG